MFLPSLRRHQRAFTLVELMIVVAILGILLALGVPAFSEWNRNTRIRNQAESLMSGLQIARAEAVKRNRHVIFQLVRRNEASPTELGRWTGCVLSSQSNHWIVSHGDPTNATTDTVGWPNNPKGDATDDIYPPDANDNCARATTGIPPNYRIYHQRPSAMAIDQRLERLAPEFDDPIPSSHPSANPIIIARNTVEGRVVQDPLGQTEVRTQLIVQAAVPAFPPPVPAGPSQICFDGMGRLAWYNGAGECSDTRTPGVDTANVATFDVSYKRAPDDSVLVPCLPAASGLRCLRIVVRASGEARLCDPTLVDLGDPRICR